VDRVAPVEGPVSIRFRRGALLFRARFIEGGDKPHHINEFRIFARCQVQKVFRNVCFRAPSDGQDRDQVDAMTASFKSSGYQLKRVFAEAATYCKGD